MYSSYNIRGELKRRLKTSMDWGRRIPMISRAEMRLRTAGFRISSTAKCQHQHQHQHQGRFLLLDPFAMPYLVYPQPDKFNKLNKFL